jgi:hypothetical protein
MPRQLLNANITHVSYVDKAANKKKFFLTKSEKEPTFQKEIKVLTKADDPQQLVYGIVYEPDVKDAHGDFMIAEDIEKAAHQFLKDARNIDKQHNFEEGFGDVVESYIAPGDITIGEETITKGSWVMVTKASDEIWEAIQKEEITGYSMAGTAEVKEVTKEEDSSGLIGKITKAISSILKGDVRDKYERSKQSRNFWSAMNSFEETVRSYSWQSDQYEFLTDETKLREALSDFNEIITEILLTDNVAKAMGRPETEIQKAGKKISSARLDQIRTAQQTLADLISEVEQVKEEGEVEVTKEELQAIVKEAMVPVTEKIEALEKDVKGTQEQVEKTEGQTETVTDDLKKELAEVIKAALAPVNDRLEAVEKARGISKAAEETEPVKKAAEGSVWDGLL